MNGFDNWRAFLLLLGPLVHGSPSTPGHRVVWFELLSQFSHLFRMEAFFAIAGLMLVRSGSVGRPGWLAGRMQQLLLPVATVWLLFNLPAIAFVRWWDGVAISAADPIHLWFLFDLAAGTALLCWLDARGLVPVPGARWQLWLAGWAAAACAARLVLYKLQGGSGIANMITGFPYYACFLYAGAVAGRATAITRWLCDTRWWWMGLPVLALGLWLFEDHFGIMVDRVPGERHPWFHLAYQLTGVLCAATMSVTVLATALRTRREHPLLRRLSRTSYSVYLVHMAPALVFGELFAATSFGLPVRFAAVVLLSLGTSWAVHALLVERSALAAFLLNGRPLPRDHSLRLAWAEIRAAMPGGLSAPVAWRSGRT